MIWSDYVTILNTKKVEEPKWFNDLVPFRELECNIYNDGFVLPSSLDLKNRYMPINVFDNTMTPLYETHLLRGKNHDFFSCKPKSIQETIEEPVRYESVYYLGWLIPHYGHFLMESLSRLWAVERAKKNTYYLFNVYNGGEKFLRNTTWAKQMLESFGISEEQIIFSTETFIADNLIVPSQALILHSGVAVDAQRHTWSKIRRKYASVNRDHGHKRIYLSRRLFKKQKRVLTNEKEVEQLFESFGFKVIFPEQLSFTEQVELFAEADIVAGPSGSALHNSAFMNPNSQLLSLTTSSFCLVNEMLACLPNSVQYSIFFGEDEDFSKWRVPLSELESSLSAFLKSSHSK